MKEINLRLKQTSVSTIYEVYTLEPGTQSIGCAKAYNNSNGNITQFNNTFMYGPDTYTFMSKNMEVVLGIPNTSTTKANTKLMTDNLYMKELLWSAIFRQESDTIYVDYTLLMARADIENK